MCGAVFWVERVNVAWGISDNAFVIGDEVLGRTTHGALLAHSHTAHLPLGALLIWRSGAPCVAQVLESVIGQLNSLPVFTFLVKLYPSAVEASMFALMMV